jgi:hypothetical protein
MMNKAPYTWFRERANGGTVGTKGEFTGFISAQDIGKRQQTTPKRAHSHSLL